MGQKVVGAAFAIGLMAGLLITVAVTYGSGFTV